MLTCGASLLSSAVSEFETTDIGSLYLQCVHTSLGILRIYTRLSVYLDHVSPPQLATVDLRAQQARQGLKSRDVSFVFVLTFQNAT